MAEVGSVMPLLSISPAGGSIRMEALFAFSIEGLCVAVSTRAPESILSGVVFVGAVATKCSISCGTLEGVTPSIIVKAGSSSTVVGLSFAS